jgi:hypothetical protein
VNSSSRRAQLVQGDESASRPLLARRSVSPFPSEAQHTSPPNQDPPTTVRWSKGPISVLPLHLLSPLSNDRRSLRSHTSELQTTSGLFCTRGAHSASVPSSLLGSRFHAPIYSFDIRYRLDRVHRLAIYCGCQLLTVRTDRTISLTNWWPWVCSTMSNLRMDNSGNRLYLNFGTNGDRLQASDRAAYPTTPSTFPQPVFPSAPGQPQNAAGGGQSAQPQQTYAGNYAPQQGYFLQNQYAAAQYQTSVQDYGAPAGQTQQTAYGQARSTTPGTNNDPNTGLAHQFSHQNLGGAARGATYAPRGPSPGQRPRTAGAPTQQSSYTSYLNPPPVPAQPSPRLEFQQAPERNPDKYGPNAHNNQKKCSQLAADFFKDSVKRARERNQR